MCKLTLIHATVGNQLYNMSHKSIVDTNTADEVEPLRDTVLPLGTALPIHSMSASRQPQKVKLCLD